MKAIGFKKLGRKLCQIGEREEVNERGKVKRKREKNKEEKGEK